MIPVFESMKTSPFQPLLHPKYYALHTELVQTQEVTGQNLKNNLRSLANFRNLVNVNNLRNRENQENRENNQNENNVEEAEGGLGFLGPRPNAGGNVFERGGFWIFKVLQLVILWQLA